MKNPPTLTEQLDSSQQAEIEHYQAILAEINAYLDTFPTNFRASVRPFFDELAQGDFSQIVALLPIWLSDLLPLPDEVLHKLGAAHLYGWWYYYVQDNLLDGDAPPVNLLGGHLALLKMVDLYTELGLADAPCWSDFQHLNLSSAAAYAREMETRFTSLEDLTPERLSPWSVELIIERGAPFYFNTIAQLHLAGVSPNQPLHSDLLAALKAFTAARQISDDAGDWLEDLRRGQLNTVSAWLMGRLYKRGLAANGGDLDIERLAGYHLRDETLWAEIEQTAHTLAQEALNRLSPYGDCKLTMLIKHQMAKNADHWASARQYRGNLRALFGINALS